MLPVLANYFQTETDFSISVDDLCGKLRMVGIAHFMPRFFKSLDPVTNNFRIKICKYVKNFLAVEEVPACPDTLSPMASRIQAEAQKLKKVSDMTLKIHGKRYYDLIVEFCKEHAGAKMASGAKVDLMGVD